MNFMKLHFFNYCFGIDSVTLLILGSTAAHSNRHLRGPKGHHSGA